VDFNDGEFAIIKIDGVIFHALAFSIAGDGSSAVPSTSAISSGVKLSSITQ
jgi:hypothetical protein